MKALLGGYVALGLLIGTLTGFSASPVVGSVTTLFFAFVGGTAGAAVAKRPDAARKIGGVMIATCLSTLAALIAALVIRSHTTIASDSAGADWLLKAQPISEVRMLNVKVLNGEIAADAAIRELLNILSR